MEKLALFARLQAKPGKEQEVENFIKKELPQTRHEKGAIRWQTLKLGPTTFGIFNAFHDEKEEDKTGLLEAIINNLMEKASELLSCIPTIERINLSSVQ